MKMNDTSWAIITLIVGLVTIGMALVAVWIAFG